MKTFWLVLVTIVWGSTFLIIKDTVTSVNEYMIVFIRSVFAFVAMLVFQLFKNPIKLINKKAFLYGIVLGILLAASYASQTIGLKYTSTGHSAFITSSAVIMVPFILFFVYHFKLIKIDIIAIVIVFSGLFLLTYDFNTEINKGDLITLITAVTYAFHVVLAGRYVNKTETLSLVTYQFLGASLASLVVWFFTDHTSVQISPKAWGALIYLGLIGTLFCYFITVWVQKYVSSLKVALIFSLEPVFAAIFGYFIIHEVLNFKETLGAVLIMVGVILHSVLKDKMIKKAQAN